MTRRTRRWVRRALPLYVGGDLEGRERLAVEEWLARDRELAAEARRCEQAYQGLRELRDLRPEPGPPEELWRAVRARLLRGGGGGAGRDRAPRGLPRVVRILRHPAARAAGIAAVVVLSFLLGFSSRNVDALLRVAGVRPPAAAPRGSTPKGQRPEGLRVAQDVLPAIPGIRLGAKSLGALPLGAKPLGAEPLGARDLLMPVSDGGTADF